MRARYAFRVELALDPRDADVALEPSTVERRCLLEAADPGSEGWRFFRDTLWRGEVGDDAHVRSLLSEKLGPGLVVERVEFRGLHTDEEYLEALKAEIEADLPAFKADTVSEVLSKYLASRLEVDLDER
ncbi:LWR-salt protein [Natrononativus amylolyticus]|uniref:LWR-salt protein n=1 Tax=Natrononativus amylolyticus TaxID=2963434 RepID=UPI0020CDB10C|nr:LWR-salt protein [Natrononativus amylolyticus]